MKKLFKLVAITLSLLIITAPLGVAAGNVVASQKRYEITSPYELIDWDAWKAYKAQLHCHTTASDGYLKVDESVQAHYDKGYDILAITDHGTLNRGWNIAPELIPVLRLVKYERTQMAPIVPLADDVYNSYLNGTAATTNGTIRENGMIDVPLGIELNFATPIADCHLTGYYAEYGQGLMGVFGDYETPAAGVNEAGGITMLSHIGEYVYPDKDSENHVGKPIDEYYVNKFARLFLDNPGSAVGMGINSATDAHTRCDRILYDQILKKTIPNDVVPWGFTFSDSHDAESINFAYTMHYMPELSNDELRTSMENGTFFSVSHYSNGFELNGMREMPEYIEEEVDHESNDTPMVTRVEIDEKNDTITIWGENFDTITWVADGNVIERTYDCNENESITIDLNDFDINYFVRFYITGEDGICYSQPFVIREENTQYDAVDVPVTKDISTFLRDLITWLDKIAFQNPGIRIFKIVLMGYDPEAEAETETAPIE